MHILNNGHEYRPINTAMVLPQAWERGTRLNRWENYYIQEYQEKGQLLEEQCAQEVNALYQLVQVYAPLNGTSRTYSTANHGSIYVDSVT